MLAALQNITQGRETVKEGLDRAAKRIKGDRVMPCDPLPA